jgi:glycosyl transferase family 25
MDIIVINLSTQTRRWESMRQQFARIGLHPTRQEAVVGDASAHLEHRYCTYLNYRQYHRRLSAGELGCYASHIAVWKRLLESDSRMLAVFEDDVETGPELCIALNAIATSHADWDLIKLIGRKHEKTNGSEPLSRNMALIDYRRVPSLTGAYVVNRRGAEKLLAHRGRFGRPVDVDLRHWWECDLQLFGVLPYPVRPAPESANSCIAGRSTPRGISSRLRRVAQQASYSIRNALALRARRRASGVVGQLRQAAHGRP